MIKVLHLRDTDRVCGPGKTILETACRVDAAHFELAIGLLMLEHEKTNQYLEAARGRGVRVLPLRARSQFSPAIIDVIAGTVRREGFDIIHSHEYKSDILAVLAARRCGVPIVTTAHGWITNSFKSRVYIWAGKQSFRFFDRVIAVSPRIREEILRFGVHPGRVELIYNAIVMDNYRPAEHEAGFLRQRFEIPPDATLIGDIGRLSPEKGQIEFLRAARELLRERPQGLYFVLVGDGPDRPRLEDWVRREGLTGRVFFTGHEYDVRPVYRDLDILALTSYTEGFPNVLLEALCMDVPVLASDVGGVSAIVEDGVTGIMVPDHDAGAVARGLRRMLDDPALCRDMVACGQARIRERFEFSVRVAKIQDLYRQVLSGRQLRG
ncbi:MAG TPA: glycosyltransferase family 1 protein [Gammaproteobacteria bacterium]|nr:glycosyltransferase family 1 protein [Gammaproteobacteria bacterium]